MGIGLGGGPEFCRLCLEHGAAPLFDFLPRPDRRVKKLLTCSCTKAFAPRHRLAVTSWHCRASTIFTDLSSISFAG